MFLADNLVRLSPAMDYKRGSLWSVKPNPHKEWMVEFSFSVYGRHALGGEGFALFYTKELGDYSTLKPDFYGRSSSFQGVAIVFDASDAANNRFNPFIYAIENNGAKTAADFRNYASPSVHLGACFREYRNAPSPVFGKLIYKDNILKVPRLNPSLTLIFDRVVDPTQIVFPHLLICPLDIILGCRHRLAQVLTVLMITTFSHLRFMNSIPLQKQRFLDQRRKKI